ncbi:hypothetical protein GBAR_LOCUS7 [Geodia barretti]|uniref:Uncharacterized protein n=1 Tax=Geodia barretti TaxID=519541 RepID=A0AA35QR39_GEOBA|nr:hypothetical protein GBAR_LOCUS7 [Geodia barretti]
MDVHGLPMWGGSGLYKGTCARAQEHARFPQLVRHSDCAVSQQFSAAVKRDLVS